MTAFDTGTLGTPARSVAVGTGGLLENPLGGTYSTVLTAAFG
ncbi:hypothetical protein FHR32_000232 [Streptosporangium album]|uniref:Uncharacterized protein n=1 Tax=Streptosporangium album TaxID=47479 RepID=A0A7W7RPR3_9ACTN|nr:hypothetical protein [Streptosporangium album]MBB4935927.1 hypothetical protein [Streptosporangium album]